MRGDQILATALTTVPTMVVVLIGILINNARLSDLGARMSDMWDSLRVEIRATREVLEARIEQNHSEMLHCFGDLDTRIGRIETSLGMGR